MKDLAPELARILGASHPAISAVVAVVEWHRSGGYRGRDLDMRRLKQVELAAARLQRELHHAQHRESHAFFLPGSLLSLWRYAEEVINLLRTETRNARVEFSPAHRPTDYRRLRREMDVAAALRNSGVPLKKARTGKLARVLAAVDEAVSQWDASQPDDKTAQPLTRPEARTKRPSRRFEPPVDYFRRLSKIVRLVESWPQPMIGLPEVIEEAVDEAASGGRAVKVR